MKSFLLRRAHLILEPVFSFFDIFDLNEIYGRFCSKVSGCTKFYALLGQYFEKLVRKMKTEKTSSRIMSLNKYNGTYIIL